MCLLFNDLQKKISEETKDQDSVQSSTIPDLEHHMDK